MNSIRKRKYTVPIILLSLIIPWLLFAGCSKDSSSKLAIAAPRTPLTVTHHGIRTLGIIELENNTSSPQISAEITDSLYQAIQKRDLFDLYTIRTADTNWKNLPIRPDYPFTLEQVMAARKMLGYDAILIGTVTSYSPYPHMSIGLHLKVIDLRDGQIVWKTEQIWDTADKTMEERIKKYYQEQVRSGYSPIDEKIAMLSSINFLKFIGYDVAKTL